jgi:beta-galactosidase
LEQSETQILVTGKDFAAIFDTKAGTLTSLKYLTRKSSPPLRPDFWRAPTDNDRQHGRSRHSRSAHTDARVKQVSGGTARIRRSQGGDGTSQVSAGNDLQGARRRAILVAAFHTREHATRKSRIGMQMTLPPGSTAWLGRGPQETH